MKKSSKEERLNDFAVKMSALKETDRILLKDDLLSCAGHTANYFACYTIENEKSLQKVGDLLPEDVHVHAHVINTLYAYMKLFSHMDENENSFVGRTFEINPFMYNRKTKDVASYLRNILKSVCVESLLFSKEEQIEIFSTYIKRCYKPYIEKKGAKQKITLTHNWILGIEESLAL